MRKQREIDDQKLGSTAWKIRIANEDIQLLKCVSQAMAAKERGLVPEPSITAMIQKAIKHYISDAFECYGIHVSVGESMRLLPSVQAINRQAN